MIGRAWQRWRRPAFIAACIIAACIIAGLAMGDAQPAPHR